jgi:exopolysaccharide production protein ExoZ
LFGLVENPQSTLLLFWSNTIILEFAMGMMLALLYRSRLVLPAPCCLALLAVGAVAVLYFNPPQAASIRLLEWGVPAAMIVAGAVLGERRQDSGPVASFVVLLGNASYAIYLTHPLFGSVVFLTWQHGLNHVPMVPALASILLLCVASSVAIYHFIERPVTRAVSRGLMRMAGTLAAIPRPLPAAKES